MSSMGDGSQSSEIHVNVDDGDDDDFLTDEKISAFLEGSLDTDDEDDIKVALAVRAANSLNYESHVGVTPESKPKKRRISKERENYSSSLWAQMLEFDHDDMMTDPMGYKANSFRRRFRVPYQLYFKVLVPMCKEKDIFRNNPRKFSIPIELKVLVALRILGRDATADDCCELSKCSETSCTTFFHQFVTNFCKHYYADWVRFPDLQTNKNEFISTVEQYGLLGLPGAIASIDATHVKLDKNNLEYKLRCTDRKAQTSIAFQVACSHSRYIFHVSEAHCGAQCDTSTLKNDSALLRALFDKYKDVYYILYDKDGTPHVVKGLYFISDNGYPRWSGLMRPMKQTSDGGELYYSEWLESVRKDIECVFGILKARFRFLRNAISYHDPAMITSAFRTAAILHNMLLHYDGYVNEFGFDLEETFEKLNPNNYFDEESDRSYKVNKSDLSGTPFDASNHDQVKLITFRQMLGENKEELMQSILKDKNAIDRNNASFESFQKLCVANFCFQWAAGETFWPQSKALISSKRHVISSLHEEMIKSTKGISSILGRLASLTEKSLLLRTSKCTPHTSVYSSLDILPNSIVATFNGVLVPVASKSQYSTSSSASSGILRPIPYMDFSIYFANESEEKSCLASKLICVNDVPITVNRPTPNCRYKVDPKTRKAYIVAFMFIPKDTELFTFKTL